MSYITVDELRIASPCNSAVWSDLKGDDRARLCTTCDMNVYNLSLMTLDEANDLIREKEGKLCIELYRRLDGTVLTADCPVGLRTIRRQYLKSRAKAIAFALSIWSFFMGTTSCNDTLRTIGIPALPLNFSADINGMDDEREAFGINDTTANEIWISATGWGNTSLWIFIDSAERAPGTYENHHGVFPAGGYYNPTKSDTNFWYAGELKITSINSSHASGTFWFNAKRLSSSIDSVIITNGKFDVSFDYGNIPH
jgi:hypothetical protein